MSSTAGEEPPAFALDLGAARARLPALSTPAAGQYVPSVLNGHLLAADWGTTTGLQAAGALLAWARGEGILSCPGMVRLTIVHAPGDSLTPGPGYSWYLEALSSPAPGKTARVASRWRPVRDLGQGRPGAEGALSILTEAAESGNQLFPYVRDAAGPVRPPAARAATAPAVRARAQDGPRHRRHRP